MFPLTKPIKDEKVSLVILYSLHVRGNVHGKVHGVQIRYTHWLAVEHNRRYFLNFKVTLYQNVVHYPPAKIVDLNVYETTK